MSDKTRSLIKDWGPIITLGLWILGHSLTVEQRLSKVEQKVEDLSGLIRSDIAEHHGGTAPSPN